MWLAGGGSKAAAGAATTTTKNAPSATARSAHGRAAAAEGNCSLTARLTGHKCRVSGHAHPDYCNGPHGGGYMMRTQAQLRGARAHALLLGQARSSKQRAHFFPLSATATELFLFQRAVHLTVRVRPAVAVGARIR